MKVRRKLEVNKVCFKINLNKLGKNKALKV